MGWRDVTFIVVVYDAQWFLAVTKIVHVASCMGNIDLRARSLMLQKHMVVHKREKPIRASCCLVGHFLTTGAFNQTIDIRVIIILEHR